MSAGSVSLESALRTCKVNQSSANKVESDRFLNPYNMVCPIWNGHDLTGRPVCPDSFMTKSRGCNSAQDRVLVENNVTRPQYMSYITLSQNGIAGHIYDHTTAHTNSLLRTNALNKAHDQTGQFGLVTEFREIIPSCGTGQAYDTAQQQMHAQNQRLKQHIKNQKESYDNSRCSGY